jgi:glycopeptide antibiotics resistance protein
LTSQRVRFALTLLLIGYSFLLIYWMFLGFGRTHFQSTGWRYNLIPFTTIKRYMVHFHSYNFRTWAINLLGNIAVFTPFGLFLPALFKSANRIGLFLIIFFLPLLVLEILQTLLRLGSFDVDDLILNVLGAVIGFVVFKGIRKALFSHPNGVHHYSTTIQEEEP